MPRIDQYALTEAAFTVPRILQRYETAVPEAPMRLVAHSSYNKPGEL